jgi:hypothetical protein
VFQQIRVLDKKHFEQGVGFECVFKFGHFAVLLYSIVLHKSTTGNDTGRPRIRRPALSVMMRTCFRLAPGEGY